MPWLSHDLKKKPAYLPCHACLPPCVQDTDDHAERLEGFYKGQAHACEQAAAACPSLLAAPNHGRASACSPAIHPPPPPTHPPTHPLRVPTLLPMLAACAARLRDGAAAEGADMVWVDLGGGTGENVDLMAQYIDLSRFKAIYVVDLCHSLCEQVCDAAWRGGWGYGWCWGGQRT